MIVATGVAPVTGGVSPTMASDEIVVAVLGNTAVITPAFAEFVTGVAPATVKKLAANEMVTMSSSVSLVSANKTHTQSQHEMSSVTQIQ